MKPNLTINSFFCFNFSQHQNQCIVIVSWYIEYHTHSEVHFRPEVNDAFWMYVFYNYTFSVLVKGKAMLAALQHNLDYR